MGNISVLENHSDNISETRKDREKVTMDNGGPIETHQRSFERYHPDPLRPPIFTSHPKLQSLLSQERVKLRTSNLSGTFIGSIRTKAR